MYDWITESDSRGVREALQDEMGSSECQAYSELIPEAEKQAWSPQAPAIRMATKSMMAAEAARLEGSLPALGARRLRSPCTFRLTDRFLANRPASSQRP
jgi:hypothetical protein